jgi:hypothetical protein
MPEKKVNIQLVCARRIQIVRLYEHSLRERQNTVPKNEYKIKLKKKVQGED